MANEGDQINNAASYRVEVSGWDATEAFFFEKAALYWDEAGQQLCLNARLREGTVVFVRLLQPYGTQENFPVPYLVSRTLLMEAAGRVSVLISRLNPKPSYRQSESLPKASEAARVA